MSSIEDDVGYRICNTYLNYFNLRVWFKTKQID